MKRIDGPQSLRSSGDVPFEFGGTRGTEEYRVCHGRRKERKKVKERNTREGIDVG